MVGFEEIKSFCKYRDNQKCHYWSRETQCHFFACPIISSKIPIVTKRKVKEPIRDSIIFNIDDFDKPKTSTLDLIQEFQTKNRMHSKKKKVRTSNTIPIKKPVQRMKCIVCDEIINDDKFTTIYDQVSDVTIYIHSIDRCKARKDQFLAVREKWLKTYSTDD